MGQGDQGDAMDCAQIQSIGPDGIQQQEYGAVAAHAGKFATPERAEAKYLLSDQVSQSTAEKRTAPRAELGQAISIDGQGRWTNKGWVRRLWRRPRIEKI